MPRILVLADDLIGANDAGAQFAKHGIPTHVLTHWQFASLSDEENTGVVVINAESRHMPPEFQIENGKFYDAYLIIV